MPTDHPTPFDHAALLAEWTRVHEAGEDAEIVLDPVRRGKIQRETNEHRRCTYAALLDVALDLIGDRDRALAEAANVENSDSAREAHAYHATMLTITLSHLTRAAREADGGAT